MRKRHEIVGVYIEYITSDTDSTVTVPHAE